MGVRIPPGFSKDLVIGLVFDPAAGVSANEELSGFVVNEDDEREGHRDEPPRPLQRVHAQHSVST